MPLIPKPPEMRQRRNKTSTRATLYVLDPPKKPDWKLPEGDWHPLTLTWWEGVLGSPMVSEYLQADYHGLILVAHLIEQYWTDPKVATAAEIRMQEQRFGLSPMDRRRLQWEVRRIEGTERPPAPPATRRDPRTILRNIS